MVRLLRSVHEFGAVDLDLNMVEKHSSCFTYFSCIILHRTHLQSCIFIHFTSKTFLQVWLLVLISCRSKSSVYQEDDQAAGSI